jgi:hypothetical protein
MFGITGGRGILFINIITIVDEPIKILNVMINPELYKKTVDILYDAYFNNTLVHGDFCACAVGNLIAANTGEKILLRNTAVHMDGRKRRIMKLDSERSPEWIKVFYTVGINDTLFNSCNYKGFAKLEIDSTGYSLQELMKIEYAFEVANKGESEEDYLFNGLIAVLDVLSKIHEVEEAETALNGAKFRLYRGIKQLC